jgi:cvfA/B/C family virulence factor
MATLTVIYWRDIPAQVNATSGRASAKARLDERFQQAIDAAAMKAGLVDAEDYLEQWRQETRSCGEALQREVAAEAERLETEFTPEVLSSLTQTGGLRSG